MKIYGMHGLDDPVIAKMDIVEMGRGFPGHEKLDIEHILSKEPTYFMFSRELTEKEDKFPEYSPGVDTILKQFYDKVAVWLNDTENNESGYFTFLQRKKNPIDLENNTE